MPAGINEHTKPQAPSDHSLPMETQRSQASITATGRLQREVTNNSTVHSLNTEYHGPIIPPSSRKNQRTLVLCFDGTGDQFDNDNSNIVLFFSLLKKGDPTKQMVYYQAGIGTYNIPQIATPLYSSISKTFDMMFASNMNHHIMGGYAFLMENYREGDRICIFGFSRGAYTARALSGMIHKVGLLPAGNVQQVPFAYRMYSEDSPEGWHQSVLFKKTFSIDVPIDFVGVWDTVSSVGIIPRRLPFTKSNTSIRVFRHAMALDEHRAKFKVSSYLKLTPLEQLLVTGKHPKQRKLKSGERHFGIRKHHQHTKHDVVAVVEDVANVVGAVGKVAVKTVTTAGKVIGTVGKTVGKSVLAANKKKQANVVQCRDEKEKKKKQDLEAEYQDEKDAQTDVLEVWFSGCHCDVGGGSVGNETKHNLARIPLRWMIRQCFEAKTEIQFEAEKLKAIGLNPHDLYPYVKQRPDPVALPSDAPEWTEPSKGAKKEKRALEMMKAREKGHILGQSMTLSESSEVGPSCPNSPTATGDGIMSDSSNGNTLVSKERRRLSSLFGTLGSRTLFTTSESSGSSSTSSLPSDVSDQRLTEEEEDLNDALCPIYDQLVLAKWWWIIEFWPIHERKRDKNGEWVKDMTVNLGHSRVLPEQRENGLKVHRSVKLRMDAKSLCYKPKLKFHVEPEWVS